jgi:oxygen-independent coproporphyrinogen-3 oxidase
MMGLYCHIPFCTKKCPYCNFYSVPSLRRVPDFLKAIKREALLYQKEGIFPRFMEEGREFDTLYLGGGTPSVLTHELIGDLILHLRTCFTFSEDMEITMEANPGDLSFESMKKLLNCGINRLNIGVQSFNQENLLFLGRLHSADQARLAISMARDAGFENLGMDLIYGLPEQSLESWLIDLERAIAFEPEHISCYQLTIEDGTIFGKRQRSRKGLFFKGDDVLYEFFTATSKRLTKAGYVHYEVSNFAGNQDLVSRHNSKYWRHIPYLGLGPSAHSFSGRERWWNHRSIDRYCRAIEKEELPIDGKEELTEAEIRLESLYMGFRTQYGLDLKEFRKTFGQDLRTVPPGVLSGLEEQGRVSVRGGRVEPTLEGMAVADAIAILF